MIFLVLSGRGHGEAHTTEDSPRVFFHGLALFLKKKRRLFYKMMIRIMKMQGTTNKLYLSWFLI